MAYLADFVCETATNPGTGTTVSLLGAAAGLPVRTFASAYTNGDRIFYTITDGAGLSEGGIGTFHTGSPNTISRDTVKANTSSSTARLNFTGSVFVFSYPPASQVVFLDELQKVSFPGAISVAGLADFSLGGMKIAAAPAASATAPLRADQSYQTITKTSMSAVAAQAILLSTSFSRFRLTLQGITVSTNSSVLSFRFSSDGGSSYVTTASYTMAVLAVNASSGAIGGAGGTAATSISLSPDLLTTGNPFEVSMEIWPGAAGQSARVRGSGYGVRATGPDWSLNEFGGACLTTVKMNACEVYSSLGGTLSGTAILEGLP